MNKQEQIKELQDRVYELEQLVKWPSIDKNRKPLEQWIRLVCREWYEELPPDSERIKDHVMLKALYEHLGVEYRMSEPTVIKKEK